MVFLLADFEAAASNRWLRLELQWQLDSTSSLILAHLQDVLYAQTIRSVLHDDLPLYVATFEGGQGQNSLQGVAAVPHVKWK
jgi:hypothetical protein